MIDTPGFGPAEADDLADLAGWAKRYGAVDMQLVLPATLSSSVFRPTLDRFSALMPTKLLLTHADEAESTGVLLDMAMRSRLPLSYVSNGQSVPEDLMQASKAELLACLTEPPAEAGQAGGGGLGRLKTLSTSDEEQQ